MSSQDAISRRIRETRQQLGLSQAQLAYPELSDSYISLIESGSRTPTPAVLKIIASKLRCSVDYLIHGIESQEVSRIEDKLGAARRALESGAKNEARLIYGELLTEPYISQLSQHRQEAVYGLALAAEACGDLDEAIRILVELREQHRDSLGDEHRIGTALALSRCYRDRGETDLAIKVAEQEIAASVGKGWTDHLIELGATMLSSYYARGDLLRAEQYATELLAHAEALGTSRAIVAANWNAAILAEITGRYEEALKRIERAWKIQAVSGEPRNRARLHVEYSSIRLRIRPEEAAECRDELLQTESELENSAASTLDLAYCKSLLGRAEVELGNGEQAVGYALESIKLAGDTNGELLAQAQVLLGQAYLMLGRVDDAAKALAAAAVVLDKEPATRATAEMWLMAAAVLQSLGDQEQSRLAYQRAMECGGV